LETPHDVPRIELRVRELSQIFNSFDPSPFYEQDLATEAEEYIVDSLKELPSKRASEIVVHLDKPAGVGEHRVLEQAVHAHFQRRASHLRRSLRDLLREGVISLVIGLAFFTTVFVLSRVVVHGEGPWSTLARESLLIGGWVALWRPMEIFLYRWWPIIGERRLYERVSRIRVRVVSASP
jgi:hypothetical protein